MLARAQKLIKEHVWLQGHDIVASLCVWLTVVSSTESRDNPRMPSPSSTQSRDDPSIPLPTRNSPPVTWDMGALKQIICTLLDRDASDVLVSGLKIFMPVSWSCAYVFVASRDKW